MKKLLLTVLCLIFFTLSANAHSGMVRPVSSAPGLMRSSLYIPNPGAGPITSYHPSSRYRTSYGRPARPSRPARPIRPIRPYYGCARRVYYSYLPIMYYDDPTPKVSQSQDTSSRFHREHTIRPKRSYVADGVRYYN